MTFVRSHPEGALIEIVAQPGARRDAILGLRGDALRVSVSAPPERGRANDSIRELLSKALGCRPSELRLLSGETHRSKKFLAIGHAPADVHERLERQLPTTNE